MNISMLLLILIAILLVRKSFRNILNPIILFAVLWCLITFLSNLRLFGLFVVSDSTQNIIFIGSLLFVIGGVLAIWFRERYSLSWDGRGYKLNREYEVNYDFFFILGLLCLIYYMPSFLSSFLSLLRGGNLNAVRQSAQSSADASGITNFIGTFLVQPSAMALEVVGVIGFLRGRRGKRLFYLSLLIIIMRLIGDAGRTPLFNLIIYLTIAVVGNRLSQNQERKIHVNKTKIIGYSFLGTIALYATTLSRTTSSIYRMLYFYFAMPPVLLDRWNTIVDGEGLIGRGLVSLNGLFFSISYILKNLFGVSYSPNVLEAYNMISNTDAIWYNIAPGLTKANAYVSMFWFFFADGRLTGVIIGSLLYGIFCGYVFCKYIKDKNVKNLALLMIVYQGVFFSFIRFPFAKSNYVLAFILIAFFAFRKERGFIKNV